MLSPPPSSAGKGLTPEKVAARLALVAELTQSIEEISDGVQSARKPSKVRGPLLLLCM